jgi:hypothetical protein
LPKVNASGTNQQREHDSYFENFHFCPFDVERRGGAPALQRLCVAALLYIFLIALTD